MQGRNRPEPGLKPGPTRKTLPNLQLCSDLLWSLFGVELAELAYDVENGKLFREFLSCCQRYPTKKKNGCEKQYAF